VRLAMMSSNNCNRKRGAEASLIMLISTHTVGSQAMQIAAAKRAA
jgi:hypothetical protein